MSDILRNFDKKNEIPKIKIPKFATGGICNDAIFPKIDAFSQIDEIVKDIRDRQDNAMAMEFTKCIEELLRKNSVVPKMTEYTSNFETENTFKTRYGVSIDELDFSEHDKVFEDKIAELKKDYKTASELLCKYQQENESLKKRIIELENFSCQAEQETESLVEKLKQRIVGLEKELEEWKEEARAVKKNRDEQLKNFRKAVEPYVDIGHMHETIEDLKQHIAELESKETEKATKINLNDRIKVKLTPLGAEIYYHQYDDIHKDYPKMKKHLQSSLPKVDENGYTEFQLWHFMELYGKYIGMCKPNVISPLDIIIVE